MDQSMILLTYKKKMLLMRRDFVRDRHEQNTLHFIVGTKSNKESFEQAVRKVVIKETGIILEAIQPLSNTDREYFFHAQLTDANVNHIVRQEGEILEFFSFKELEKLLLSDTTKLFIQKHRDVLEKVDAM